MTTVNFSDYYHNYHGHWVRDLRLVRERFNLPGHSIVYFAGDSSLDNKYWLGRQTCPAVNGYEKVISPPLALPDVAYHLNSIFASVMKGVLGLPQLHCINAAVEESTLGERGTKITDQDHFIRDNIQDKDVLVVSVGGNDIALKPTCCTACNMLWLSCCSCTRFVKNGSAWGLGHFRTMFKQDLEAYLCELTARHRPALIIPAMIYYPDENSKAQSWANCILSCLCYNCNPGHVQAIIDRVFEDGMKKVQVAGSKVVPLPFSQALNGKNTADYVARVEPSDQGGAKMAHEIANIINLHYPRDLK